MKAIIASETSITIHQTIRRNVSENSQFHMQIYYMILIIYGFYTFVNVSHGLIIKKIQNQNLLSPYKDPTARNVFNTEIFLIFPISFLHFCLNS
jgi:hypothetical protein